MEWLSNIFTHEVQIFLLGIAVGWFWPIPFIPQWAAKRERERCAKIAERNAYMNHDADTGGNFGGPGRCEYGCGEVIARAIRNRPTAQEAACQGGK